MSDIVATITLYFLYLQQLVTGLTCGHWGLNSLSEFDQNTEYVPIKCLFANVSKSNIFLKTFYFYFYLKVVYVVSII